MPKSNSLSRRHWTDIFRKKKATSGATDTQASDTGTSTGTEQYSFWESQLQNLPASLELPTDHSRKLGRAPLTVTKVAIESVTGSPPLSKELRRLATEEDVSLYALFLSVYVTLLYRYTGQEDLIVACTGLSHELSDSAAPSTETEQLLFIRPAIEGDKTFRELLSRVEHAIVAARSNLPLPEILQATSADQDHNSLFQIRFAFFENTATTQITAINNTLAPTLSLAISQDGDQFLVQFHYDASLFDATTIQRLLNHYKNMLTAITSEPDQPLSELILLSTQERQQLLTAWNNSHIEFPRISSVHELFESRVAESPDAIAIAFRDERLSYSDLNARANQLANYLRTLGAGPDLLTGIYMDRCIDAVIAILGVLKAGGSYLPLDASYPKDRLSFIMKDAQADILLTHANLAAGMEQQDARLLCIDRDWDQIAEHSAQNLDNHTQPQHLAFVLYTSGSTGDPKGVEVTHANLINYYFAWEHTHQLRTSISGVCQMTFFSFAVFQGDVVRALCSGKKLVLCSRETLMSPRQLYELMRREQADFAEFVPVLLRGLIDYVEETAQRLDFMKVIIVGADRWYVREHKRVQSHCGPHTRFIHVYGLSETTLDSTYFQATDAELDDNQLVPIGRPFPNVQVYVLDSHRQPVPVGVAGTLYVGGAGVAKGYHNRPDLTNEKFAANPFIEDKEARLYNTGDLARYLPDGNIAFLGRSDHQVKIRGFRVELGEVEAALEQHPAIRTAIVQPWHPSSGVTQLAAYYVAMQESAPSTNEVRDYLAQKLPDFMLPAYYVPLDALPLTPSGKINRRALPEPSADTEQIIEHAASPASEIQQTVTDICKHALGVTNLAPDDNFTKRGGDSMAIMTMVTGLENNFGIELEEEDINLDLFATVNTLTAYVESKTGAEQR